MSKRPDTEMLDDDNPELDEKWFKNAVPFSGLPYQLYAENFLILYLINQSTGFARNYQTVSVKQRNTMIYNGIWYQLGVSNNI